MIDLKISGATRIEVRFGDHVRVLWQSWRNMWDVFTDGQFLVSISTFQGACDWAERYVEAREEALRVFGGVMSDKMVYVKWVSSILYHSNRRRS